MEYNYDTYMVTCDKCSREWDGNAQCPCGLNISSSDDDIFSEKYNLSPLSVKRNVAENINII